jgi:hypothetical protein
VAERVTLAEAAACFRTLNAIYPDCCSTNVQRLRQGVPEEERWAGEVIEWTCEELLASRPEQVAPVRARLEAELAASRAKAATPERLGEP